MARVLRGAPARTRAIMARRGRLNTAGPAAMASTQVTPTSRPPAVPGRRVVPAGNRRSGCSLVLQHLPHVESHGSPGGEEGGPYLGHHRKQDESGELLAW